MNKRDLLALYLGLKSMLLPMLIARKYNKNIVNNSIERALLIPRETALLKIVKTKTDRVTLEITFQPRA